MSSNRDDKFETAVQYLATATAAGHVSAATLYVRRAEHVFARSFGAARSADAVYLVASISKPITAAAVLTLCDQDKIALDDPVVRFLPEFKGEARETITVRQLLSHISGLPDHVPENQSLRRRHADLAEFVQYAVRTPLLFAPGSQYQYSSMGILLASEVAQRVSGVRFQDFVQKNVFQRLGMERSALGLGKLRLEDTMQCQIEAAAPESGAGSPTTKQWDWNSRYWRSIGAPWGGVHATAHDIAVFFREILYAEGRLLRPQTAQQIVRNHNPAEVRPRGLGFALGTRSSSPACSERTFGHEGATGTLAWADPVTGTIFVVLTTLPKRAANPHPRQVVSDLVAAAVA